MAQIRIDDEVYARLREAADFNKRTVGQHILFLLDNEITFNEIRGMLKNKTENPAWDVPKPSCEIGSGSQANNQEPTAEHIGRREVFTVPQLISKIDDIRQKADEEAEYCQDHETIKRIYDEAEQEIAPIQAEIDRLSKA